MNFESYAERINTLRNIDTEHEQKKLTQERLQVKKYSDEDDKRKETTICKLKQQTILFFRWNYFFTFWTSTVVRIA